MNLCNSLSGFNQDNQIRHPRVGQNSSTQLLAYFAPDTTALKQLQRHLSVLERIFMAGTKISAGTKLNWRQYELADEGLHHLAAIGLILSKTILNYLNSTSVACELDVPGLSLQIAKLPELALFGGESCYNLSLNGHQWRLSASGLHLFSWILTRLAPLLLRFGLSIKRAELNSVFGYYALTDAELQFWRGISDCLIFVLGIVEMFSCMSYLAHMEPHQQTEVSIMFGATLLAIGQSLWALEDLWGIFIDKIDQAKTAVWNKICCSKRKHLRLVLVTDQQSLSAAARISSGLQKILASISGVENHNYANLECIVCQHQVQLPAIINLTAAGMGIAGYCLNFLQEWERQKPGINPSTNARWDGLLIYLRPDGLGSTTTQVRILAASHELSKLEASSTLINLN